MRKTLYILLVLMCLGLQGCVVLAAAGAGAAGTAAVVNDRRSMQTMIDDQNIERTAQTQIYQDPAMQGSRVGIVAFNHAVLLVGQVPTSDEKVRVQNIVQALPKVSRIYNELEVGPAVSSTQASKDTWITTEVKTKMLTTKDLNSGQIKVVTENGSVFLMGIVTKKQGDLASDAARRVNGVKAVVTLFEYTYL